MSSTRGSAGRVGGAHDDYSTPPDLCTAAVDWLGEAGLLPIRTQLRRPRVLEPSAGSGNFVHAMLAVLHDPRAVERPAFDAVDIASEKPQVLPSYVGWHVADFLSWRPTDGYDLVLGNPPYGRVRVSPDSGEPIYSKRTGKPMIDPVAALHVERALGLLNPGGVLAFILRLGFFETGRHAPLLERHPVARVIETSPRPRFVGRGDSAPYCLAVWRLGWAGPATFQVGRWGAA